jgi:uncharacterized cupin superfamily protein
VETKLSHISRLRVASGTGYRIKQELFAGRHEQRLAKTVGITQFGVNILTLDPGAWSALRHWHEAEDEFVYVLDGVLTLVDDNGAHELTAGSIVGFPAGEPNGHHLQNRSDAPASYIVVGSRRPGEETIHYPDDDLGPVRK